jgi:protein gp37
MGKNTAIPWCHHTFNGWWGCHKVSPGCKFCYAETWSRRTGHGSSKLAIWGQEAPRRFFGDHHWNEPLKWNREALERGERPRVFLNSMADTFEDRRDLDEQRARLWALIERTPALIWMALTKRIQHVADMVPRRWLERWPQHVWLGTTTEDQERLEERAPVLLQLKRQAQIPVVYLSAEPLLGPLDLALALPPSGPMVDMVIVGGESGSQRKMQLPWATQAMFQTRAAGALFFFKQTGNILAREMGLKDLKGGAPGAAHLPPGARAAPGVRPWTP